jgi:predicted nucleic acid-binding protein
VKWFHSEGEDELAPARALREAHLSGQAPARVLDLAQYEFGNVLLRRLGLPADRVGAGLAALRTTVGEPITFAQTWAKLAARFGEAHALTFHDACWAAAARHLGVPLVSADRQLLDAGLAESPTATATRLGLLT